MHPVQLLCNCCQLLLTHIAAQRHLIGQFACYKDLLCRALDIILVLSLQISFSYFPILNSANKSLKNIQASAEILNNEYSTIGVVFSFFTVEVIDFSVV